MNPLFTVCINRISPRRQRDKCSLVDPFPDNPEMQCSNRISPRRLRRLVERDVCEGYEYSFGQSSSDEVPLTSGSQISSDTSLASLFTRPIIDMSNFSTLVKFDTFSRSNLSPVQDVRGNYGLNIQIFKDNKGDNIISFEIPRSYIVRYRELMENVPGVTVQEKLFNIILDNEEFFNVTTMVDRSFSDQAEINVPIMGTANRQTIYIKLSDSILNEIQNGYDINLIDEIEIRKDALRIVTQWIRDLRKNDDQFMNFLSDKELNIVDSIILLIYNYSYVIESNRVAANENRFLLALAILGTYLSVMSKI